MPVRFFVLYALACRAQGQVDVTDTVPAWVRTVRG